VPFDGPPLDMESSSVDTATEPQIRLMAVLMNKAAIDTSDARQVLKERYGKVSRTLLTKGEASDFIDWLQSQQPREQPALVN
jgi:thymidine kinase